MYTVCCIHIQYYEKSEYGKQTKTNVLIRGRGVGEVSRLIFAAQDIEVGYDNHHLNKIRDIQKLSNTLNRFSPPPLTPPPPHHPVSLS